MSDTIEEKLKESYCNMEIEVRKADLRTYIILITIDWNKGFKFNYPWDERLTIDSNIDEIKKYIDELLVKYFKKVRT